MPAPKIMYDLYRARNYCASVLHSVKRHIHSARQRYDYTIVGLKSLYPVKQTTPWGHEVLGPRAEKWTIYGELPIIELIESLQPRGTCIDVGSWIGKYALLMSKTAERVIAIEPDKRNFHFLQKNIALNNIENIEAIRAAADVNDGMVKLKISPSAAGHSLTGNESSYGYQVKTISFSNLLEQLQNVELVKMDIEAVEFRLLPSLGNNIKIAKKWIVECHHATGLGTEQELGDIFTKHGYSTRWIGQNMGSPPYIYAYQQ